MQILTGHRLAATRARVRLSMLRYLLQPRRYPLFVVRASRGGVRRTLALQKSLGMTKLARLGRRHVLSLNLPHWPSAAFDHMVRGGGLNLAAAGTPLKKHIDTVLLSVTRRCRYSCARCYERAALGTEEAIDVVRWKQVIAQLQDVGVGVLVLSGGEPMERFDDVLELLRCVDHSRSDVHIATSGKGLTPERSRALARAGVDAVGVGLDHFDPGAFDRLRGHAGAFGEATGALRCLRDASVFTYVNTCLSRGLVEADGLERHLRLAEDVGAGIVRYLEPKTCAPLDAEELAFGEEERRRTEAFVERAATDETLRSCPSIQYLALTETPERLGCGMGGLSHFAIDANGNVLPCPFLPVSFGNILEEDIAPILGRMRTRIPRPLRSECPVATLGPTLRSRALPIPVEQIADEWNGLDFGTGRPAFGPTARIR